MTLSGHLTFIIMPPLLGAVYTNYYQKNSPGVFFSYHVMTCLLSALLKAGLLGDILTVLRVSLSHNLTVSCSALCCLVILLITVSQKQCLLYKIFVCRKLLV